MPNDPTGINQSEEANIKLLN